MLSRQWHFKVEGGTEAQWVFPDIELPHVSFLTLTTFTICASLMRVTKLEKQSADALHISFMKQPGFLKISEISSLWIQQSAWKSGKEN